MLGGERSTIHLPGQEHITLQSTLQREQVTIAGHTGEGPEVHALQPHGVRTRPHALIGVIHESSLATGTSRRTVAAGSITTASVEDLPDRRVLTDVARSCGPYPAHCGVAQ